MAIRLAAGDESRSRGVAGSESLAASGINKFFGSMQALKSVDLVLRAGEVHALVGANGAGKSTLSRILCGHTMPEAGEIRIRGRPMRFTSPRDGLAAGVAMVTQETTLAPDLPVIENIFLPHMGSPGRLSRPALAREAEAIIADLDIALGFSLSDRVRRPPHCGTSTRRDLEGAGGRSGHRLLRRADDFAVAVRERAAVRHALDSLRPRQGDRAGLPSHGGDLPSFGPDQRPQGGAYRRIGDRILESEFPAP